MEAQDEESLKNPVSFMFYITCIQEPIFCVFLRHVLQPMSELVIMMQTEIFKKFYTHPVSSFGLWSYYFVLLYLIENQTM